MWCCVQLIACVDSVCAHALLDYTAYTCWCLIHSTTSIQHACVSFHTIRCGLTQVLCTTWFMTCSISESANQVLKTRAKEANRIHMPDIEILSDLAMECHVAYLESSASSLPAHGFVLQQNRMQVAGGSCRRSTCLCIHILACMPNLR